MQSALSGSDNINGVRLVGGNKNLLYGLAMPVISRTPCTRSIYESRYALITGMYTGYESLKIDKSIVREDNIPV